MLELPTEDNVLLVKFYFQSGESVTSAIRHFCTTKGIRRKESEPSFNTVKRIINTFLDTGSVHVKKRIPKGEARTILTPYRKSSKKSPHQVVGQLLRAPICVKNKSSLGIKKELELFPYNSQDERLLTDRARA